MKKIISLLLVVSMFTAACMTLASCDFTPGDDPDSSTTYVNLSINPEISMTVDGAGKVTAVIGENEDGKVLLYGETGIEGQSVEVATEKIIDLAVAMGFISEDNKTVETLVSSTDEKVESELLNKINSKITATASKSGISVTTSVQGAYELLRDLEALKADNPNNAAIQSLTVKDYKLALSASENGNITFEAAIELDDSALIKLLSDTYSEIEQYQTEAYNEAKAKALAVYDKALALKLDAVYTAFYAANTTAHPLTGYLGVLYQLYAMSEHSFLALVDGLALIEEMESYELSSARVAAILAPLGLTEAELYKIQDSEGKITLASVNAYVTVYLDEISDTPEFATISADIEAALDATEAEIEAQITELTEQYKPMINDVVTYIQPTLASAEAMLSTYKGLGILSDDRVTALLRAYREGMDISNAAVTGGELDAEALKQAADKMKTGRLAVLDAIEDDLSDDELIEIDAMKKQIEDDAATERAAFESALDTAANSAKSHLQNLKNQYLSRE